MTDVITVTDTVAVADPVTETVEVGYIAQTVSSSGGTMASTVTDETTYGVAKAVGTSTASAREDHTHGSPSLGATSTTAAAGNHAHTGVYVPASTVTTKGDLIAATGNAALTRLPAGPNNQVLTADSAQASGLKWATPGGYTLNPAIYGLVALSQDPMNSQGNSDPGNNTLWAHRVWVPAGVPLAGLWVAVNARGTWDAVTTGSTIGLYDDAGTLTDSIVTNNALWNGSGSAWCGGALAAGTIAGGAGRFVYILALARGMTGLSLVFPNSPNDTHGGYAAVPVGGGNRRAFYVAGSSLPASFNPVTVGTATGYGVCLGAS